MKVVWLIIGIIIGILLTLLLVKTQMPKMMLTVHESKLDFEETVTSIEVAAKANGWKVPKIYNIQKTISEAGYDDLNRIKVISICQPEHAREILLDDKRKPVTAIMPCRIGVYETMDGKVMISEMNLGLMSKMFGGVIEKVMSQVAKEEAEMMKAFIK